MRHHFPEHGFSLEAPWIRHKKSSAEVTTVQGVMGIDMHWWGDNVSSVSVLVMTLPSGELHFDEVVNSAQKEVLLSGATIVNECEALLGGVAAHEIEVSLESFRRRTVFTVWSGRGYVVSLCAKDRGELHGGMLGAALASFRLETN